MKTMKLRSWILGLVAMMGLSSCEEVIDIDLDEGTPQLNVDAFVTTQLDTQKVRLTKTSPYFANIDNPAVTGATVVMVDNLGNIFPFVDAGDGDYFWYPSGSPLCEVGRVYTLVIESEGETFQATSYVSAVPVIDSVTYEFREGQFGNEDGYWAKFWASDLPGQTDFYWVKSFRNGVWNSRPSDIITSVDAAFGTATYGSGTDGYPFIPPVAEGITPFDTPYQMGDSVHMELHAITYQTYEFLNISLEQMNNAGLFATPPTNVPCNIFNANPDSKVKAVGWFSTSCVREAGIRIK